jgi:hypothetical protein
MARCCRASCPLCYVSTSSKCVTDLHSHRSSSRRWLCLTSREEGEAVVDELLDVLDAVCDDQHRCFLTFEDFGAAVKLAVARAVESGQLLESIDRLEPGRAFFEVATQAVSPQLLPFSLARLADELFPSPFTDPVLPLGDGRPPAPDEVDHLFGRLVPEPWVFHWDEQECLVLRDADSRHPRGPFVTMSRHCEPWGTNSRRNMRRVRRAAWFHCGASGLPSWAGSELAR